MVPLRGLALARRPSETIPAIGKSPAMVAAEFEKLGIDASTSEITTSACVAASHRGPHTTAAHSDATALANRLANARRAVVSADASALAIKTRRRENETASSVAPVSKAFERFFRSVTSATRNARVAISSASRSARRIASPPAS